MRNSFQQQQQKKILTKKMIPSSLLLLLLTFLLSFSTLIAANNDNSSTTTTLLISRYCSNITSLNSEEFDGNFVDSMEFLSQKISLSPPFALSVSGTNLSARVYGLAQCFNYLSTVDCRLCFAQTRVEIPRCLPSLSAHVFLNGCFLRYGNYNFSQESLSDDTDKAVCESLKRVEDESDFKEVGTSLIEDLTTMGGDYEDSNGSYYKEGNVSVSSSKNGVKIYGVAQCWRSLNKSGCKECLDNARERIVGCLPGSDGRALNAGCFVRYSLDDPFHLMVSSSSTNASSVTRRVGIALASICIVVLILGAAILWKRKKSSKGDDFMNMDGSTSHILSLVSKSHLSFKYDDLRKATNDFDLVNKLGQGGYGSVYKGVLLDGREIAVKRLFFQANQWLEQFFNEVNLISSVQHKNLVKLFGCSVDGPEGLLVYEYLCNTSLDQFLFDSFRKVALDWGRRFDILVGSAEGLAYLHKASEVRIIHRDIKASNILLDEKFKAKIADFGLARFFAEGQSHLSTGVAGTLGYMAPEYIVHGQLTEKADVYSYGVLVLEVVTGRKNTTSIATSSEGHSLLSQIWNHFTSKSVIEMLDPNLREECNEELVLKVFHVGLLCTQTSPKLRPPMWKVVEMLTSNTTTTRDLPFPTQPPFINIKGAELRSSGSESSGGVLSSSSKYPVSANEISVSMVHGR